MAAQKLQELFEQEKGNEKSNEKANLALKKSNIQRKMNLNIFYRLENVF